MLSCNTIRNLSVATLALGALIACSSDDSGTPAAGGSAGTTGGTACAQACAKFENECKAGTCTVSASGTCDGKAKEWSDCINSHPCDQKDDCTALLVGGNGGSAGAGGSGGTACVTLGNKCSACGSNYQMMTQCATTAQGKDETACQTMLDDAAFQAACP